MNRLRRKRGDGWTDTGNPARALLLGAAASVSVACGGVMLLGVVPRAVLDGDGLLAIVGACAALLNVFNAWSFGRDARDEWRGYR